MKLCSAKHFHTEKSVIYKDSSSSVSKKKLFQSTKLVLVKFSSLKSSLIFDSLEVLVSKKDLCHLHNL